MKRLLISMVPIVGLVLMSCFGTGPADYHPLEVGHKWEDKTTTITTRTTYVPDTSETTDTLTLTSKTEITDTDKLSSGEEVYVAKSTTYGEDTTETISYIRKDEDSVYTYTSLEDTVPVYTEPAELDVGTEWTHKMTVDTLTYTTTYKVEGKEDVTVEAGEYKDCLKVKVTSSPEAPNTTITTYQYRAKDVGMVQSTMDMVMEFEGISKTETHTTNELTKFTK